MAIRARRPTAEEIGRFLETQDRLGLTYSEVGATAVVGGPLPAGYVVDHTRVALGRGELVYERAVEALRGWEQFRRLGWVEARPEGVPLRVGERVAIVARRWGLWWLTACRIVALIETGEDDAGPVRFGFAYGTLPDHAGTGEERFLLEWDRAGTDEVWFDILAFSRPQWLLTRVAYAYMRHLQRRFGPESAAALARAVREGGGQGVA